MRFFHFNVCGGVCNGGSEAAVVPALERSIAGFRPAAVSLNEVCLSQYRALRVGLARRGFAMDGRWIETMDTQRDCHGHHEGIALLSRRPILDAAHWRLPRPRADVRTLLCASVRLRRPLELCTTHVAPYDSDKRSQIADIAALTRFAADLPTVLMGDFNVTPGEDHLDLVYARALGDGSRGLFREVGERVHGSAPCRCGEPTFERVFTDPKIEYIFLSEKHWTSLWSEATSSPFSDHDPLRGSAVLRD